MKTTTTTLALSLALSTLAAPAFAQDATDQAPEAKPDVVARALAPRSGGLTPDDVASAASATSFSVRAKQAELRAAAAKVDQALVAYFPRLSVTSTTTWLSPVTNTIGEGAQSISFDSVDKQYSFVAQMSVPVSDYLLRITHAHASASRAADAKRHEVEAQELQAEADARIAYFEWVKAKGQVVVARQAVAQAKAHVADARRLFETQMASQGDVMRLDAQVASAEKVEAEAEAYVAVAELQLRTMMHAPADKPLEIGIDVLHAEPKPPRESIATLEREAATKRPEMRVYDQNYASMRESEASTRAGFMPRGEIFGNVTVANPNQRVFPQQDRWDATWEAGLRVTWTVNDTFTTLGATAELRGKADAIREQKAAFRDALRIEIGSAYADARKAPATVAAAERGLVAAEEALRVQGELFRAGKANAVSLVDAETELTRARLSRIDEHVDVLVAGTKLDHAIGRDAARRGAR